MSIISQEKKKKMITVGVGAYETNYVMGTYKSFL